MPWFIGTYLTNINQGAKFFAGREEEVSWLDEIDDIIAPGRVSDYVSMAYQKPADYSDRLSLGTYESRLNYRPFTDHEKSRENRSELDSDLKKLQYDQTPFSQLSPSDLPDTIDGNTGNDLLVGGGGADEITGGDGDDFIFGQEGDDRLFGQNDDDSLDGGEGDDRLEGGSGSDTLHGGNDDDKLYGGIHADELHGGAGQDQIWGGSHGDRIFGGSDGDKLYGSHGYDTIDGGYGHDTIEGGDSVYQWFSPNIVDDGDDNLYGRDGNDHISGGFGNDYIEGGYGDDTIYGNSRYNDALFGGPPYPGSPPFPKLGWAPDDDHIRAGVGNDRAYGQGGADIILGGSGNDTLRGEGGADRLFGEEGNDELVGGGSRDVLHGGFRDIWSTETDNDLLIGGSSYDRFVFEGKHFDNDRILDFGYGGRGGKYGDVIWIDVETASNFDYFDSNRNGVLDNNDDQVRVTSEGTKLTLWEGTIMIEGVTDLNANDFRFDSFFIENAFV